MKAKQAESRFDLRLPKELHDQFRASCKAVGMHQTQVTQSLYRAAIRYVTEELDDQWYPPRLVKDVCAPQK